MLNGLPETMQLPFLVQSWHQLIKLGIKMKELGIRGKNQKNRNVICKTWNNDQYMKEHPTCLLSKEQKFKHTHMRIMQETSFMLYMNLEQ